MKLVKENHDNRAEELDLPTLVPKQLMESAYLRKLEIDIEFAERRLDRVRKQDAQAAAETRFRIAATMASVATFLLLLASIVL